MNNLKLIRPSISSESYGGKANNLIVLNKMEVNVPQWVVIPKEIMSNQLKDYDTIEELHSMLAKLEVPNKLLADMEFYFGTNYRDKKYAVRSSSVDEDGKEFSFAGQYETALNVDYVDLKESIKEVWKSVGSKHLLAYRKKHGIDMDLSLAVIIQEMVQSEVSGVAFGLDPLTGDRNKKVISAVHGLGEGLVSGKLNADNFTISPEGIETKLAHKADLAVAKNNSSTLDENQLSEISDLLDALNQKTGHPQDVEFSYYNNQLYVLQTRPITTSTDSNNDEYLLWDNSNIVESYPGVTTPLTFSFISKMYAAVYAQFSELLGVPTKKIAQHKAVFQNTLGLVRGRVYYNLVNWYKMLAMVPGYSINATYMETMMGVKEKFELGDEFKMSRSKAWFRIILMLGKMIFLQSTLTKKRIQFQNYLDKKLKVYNDYDFASMSIPVILEHYKNFETTLVKEWKVPLINDFFSMIWFGMLKKQASKHVPESPNLHNDLLCGSEDIISVQPIHRTFALAKMIKSSEETRSLFLENTPEDIWQNLENGNHPELKKKIDRYLHDFGERCMGELKLETTSYTQKPSLFIKILKSYVSNDISSKLEGNNLQNKLRSDAEQKIYQALKNKPLAKMVFKFILNKARDLVSNRENLRYERTRAFGVVRKMFSAIGTQLKKQNIIQDSKDIFYLELEELLNLDTKNYTQLVHQIRIRKASFGAYKLQPSPQERFYTYGHNFNDKYIYSEEKVEPVVGDLQGIGCCPGQVRARVQLIENPESIDSLNGDILVTKSTDPGWVTLFPSASAIIVERGSLLSHSAIVSREMGIPCIVSVDGLLRTLKTGDEVLMDGSTGTIKILNKEKR